MLNVVRPWRRSHGADPNFATNRLQLSSGEVGCWQSRINTGNHFHQPQPPSRPLHLTVAQSSFLHSFFHRSATVKTSPEARSRDFHTHSNTKSWLGCTSRLLQLSNPLALPVLFLTQRTRRKFSPTVSQRNELLSTSFSIVVTISSSLIRHCLHAASVSYSQRASII